MQKISELLINAGTDRIIAGVIEVLADGKWHSMREIERTADLRQPEVSGAISHLSEYVELRNSKGARGRPQKCVRGVRLREYVDEIRDGRVLACSHACDALDAAMSMIAG